MSMTKGGREGEEEGQRDRGREGNRSGERCGEGGMKQSPAMVTHLETVKAGDRYAWSDFVIVCINS